MLVKDWLPEFLDVARPEVRDDGGEWHAWLNGLIKLKATRAEAETAERRLREQEVTVGTPAAHLAAILAEITTIRTAAAQPAPDDREEAQRQSRGCPYCEGSGQAAVYHPEYDATRPIREYQTNGRLVRAPSRVVGHCLCPMGRWTRSRLDRETAARIPDFALAMRGELTAGGVQWLPYDPSEPEEIEPDYFRGDDGHLDVRAMAASLAQRGKVESVKG